MGSLLLIIFIVVILCILSIVSYNKMQRLMQSIREQLSNLQASLKKRIDLANQIIDIASGYGEHEKLTHMKVSNNQSSLDNIVALAQNYPQLKANETYQLLMSQLEKIEQNIQQKRESYNYQVKSYNGYINSFPVLLIASRLSFETAPYFDISDPDFSEKVKIFQRDDSEALQHAITSTVNNVKNSAVAVKKAVTDKLNEEKQ